METPTKVTEQQNRLEVLRLAVDVVENGYNNQVSQAVNASQAAGSKGPYTLPEDNRVRDITRAAKKFWQFVGGDESAPEAEAK